DHVVVTWRTRAGRGMNMWDSDHLALMIPPHADCKNPPIDERLLGALVAAPATEHEHWRAIVDSIHYFNFANTDSDDFDEAFEMVLTVPAYQRFLGTQHKRDAARKAILCLAEDVQSHRLRRAASVCAVSRATDVICFGPVAHWYSELHSL